MRNDSAAQSRVPNTERSEQKVQGHVPGQGQGVKPIVGTGQSLNRRKPTKRCRVVKEEFLILFLYKG